MRNPYKMLVGKCEGKRPLELCGSRWETGSEVWTGFIRLRIGMSGGLLWTR